MQADSYTKDIAIVERKTKELLLLNGEKITSNEAIKLCDQLKAIIYYHDNRYYILNDPVISDSEYDRLFNLLKVIEKKWPELRTPDSPTQRIPGATTKGSPKIIHLTPMLSLDNSYNQKDLIEFDRRIQSNLKTIPVIYTAEPKFDGTGISLVYENDILIRGSTRGNGIEGEDITNNLKTLRTIPLKAFFSSLGIYKIEIRGEVLIKKETFKKINEQRLKEGLSVFANARNVAAGSLRLQDPVILSSRKLEAFVYQVSLAVNKNGKDILSKNLSNHKYTIELLHKFGFNTPYKQLKYSNDIKELLNYCLKLEKKRNELQYEIDGVVIKLNDYKECLKLGYTSHHPRWALAYKFKPRQATTILKNVEFHVGKTGTITPVAKLEPVSLAGVTIRSSTLHNEAFVKGNDLWYGDTVLIERAGDVIPYIVKPITELRPPGASKIEFPDRCPSCNSRLHKEKDEAAWRCLNLNCPGQILEKLLYFCRTMDIEGLGEKTVITFYQKGIIKSITDIFSLDYDKIRKLERFGEKSVNNLKQEIQKSKRRPLNQLIAALSIPYIGWNTALLLSQPLKDISDLYHCKSEELLKIKGLGPKAASAVCKFFNSKENIHIINNLKSSGVKTSSQIRGKLSGLKFVLTGKLKEYTRQQAKSIIEALGGEVKETISREVNYLIAGEDPGSKLIKAEKAKIKILKEKDFRKIVK